MRGAWGLISLLIAMAIVGLVAKQRLTTMAVKPAASSSGVSAPMVNTPAQAQQLQQQVQDDVNRMMQSRPVDIDKRMDEKP